MKICPMCNELYSDTETYCIKCNIELTKKSAEDEKLSAKRFNGEFWNGFAVSFFATFAATFFTILSMLIFSIIFLTIGYYKKRGGKVDYGRGLIWGVLGFFIFVIVTTGGCFLIFSANA